MNRPRILLLAVMGLLPVLAPARTTENFDAGWRFLKSDTAHAEAAQFNDFDWRKLDVPHDWSIEGPFAQTNKTGGAGGFLPSGVGWYRKHFTLPASASNQIVRIEFDGVMQNSDVWINGHHLGHRPNGYVSFGYDLTGKLNFGGDNVLAVRCDTAAQPASRWYSGAGIYRHVRLVTMEPVHFVENGIFISTPQISATNAIVRVQATVTNATRLPQEINVAATLNGPPHSAPDGSYGVTGESKPFSVPAGQSVEVAFEIAIPWAPRLWSVEHPEMHSARVRLRSSGQVLDDDKLSFGIRTAEFTATNGFLLNGQKIVLKGVCLHHDGGAFGAAVPLDIWEARLKTLRTLGVNAIRTAHNPPAPEFLDLCDRMGFLVMDEFFDCWKVAKKPYDYHLFFNQWWKRDAADMIRRDRNHPSVILWSIGNEILDTPKPDHGIPAARGLVEVCHENDPTRPATQALFRPNVSGDYTNGLADLLDVIGTNYRDNELLAAQRAKPERKIINTEQKHTREAWLTLRDNPSLAGQFLWVGVDYLGEARSWPRVSYAGGLLDRTGSVKPSAYERQSWWSDAPMVRIVRRTAANDPMPGDPGFGEKEMFTQVQFADWTPRNPKPHDETVEAYSNCEEVELFLNGKSLGAKMINADASPRVWKIPFEPGTLKAVARNVAAGILPAVKPGILPGGKNAEGKTRVKHPDASGSADDSPDGKMPSSTAGRMPAATDELRTAGKAEKIELSTEAKSLAPGFDHVAIVRAKITDADGVEIPRADDLVSFTVSGPGVIVAVDNGDNDSHEPFQAAGRHAFHGECVAYVKATAPQGKIKITATAAGLKAGETAIAAGK